MSFQEGYAGSSLKIVVNVVDDNGDHVAATINTTTTRIEGYAASAPTVTTIGTGIYQLEWTGLSPALAEGDFLVVKVNGDISSTVWTEYGIPVLIRAAERGTDSSPDAAAIADAIWDELTAGHSNSGSFGERIGDILADTADLQANQGNWLTATGFNTVAPDNASIAAILTDTDVTIPGLIAALNNLSAAQVNAEVDTALADYDGPTKAELDAGLAALNDPSAADIADAVWDEPRAGHTTAGTFGLYLDAQVSTVGGGSLTAGEIADAVWTEALGDHSGVSGSTAEALAAAGGAGDPWITPLPGSYTGTQAGKILADILTDTGTTLPATLATIEGKVDAVGTVADAILVDTGTTIPASLASLATSVEVAAVGTAVAGLNDFDPATDTVANVGTVATVTNDVNTNAASRTASQADVSGIATELAKVPKKDVAQTWTNQGGDTHTVTVTQA